LTSDGIGAVGETWPVTRARSNFLFSIRGTIHRRAEVPAPS